MKPRQSNALGDGLWKTLVLNTTIAIGISLFGDYGFWGNLVYSHCIGLSIGGFIDLGRYLFIRSWSLHRRRLVAVVPAGVVLGFFFGNFVADLLLGGGAIHYWVVSPSKAWGMLFMSLVAGTLLTHEFVSREILAKERENAEAARRQASEAQLRLLEAQLEPHMLFNTLANLRALITLDPPRAQTMLDHMIAYLRATLSASRADGGRPHTLEDEFARLQDYLELMTIRMGPRLQFTLDLPEALRSQPVPPLLLQPLVENSIQHGLEPKVAGGSIRVSAARLGEMLALEVADTGLGYPDAPDQATAPHTGRGFGLQQVRDRLQTAFGALGALKIVATPAEGTRASITFPLKT
ncbi:sensor histidine kinase [Acidovorax sp.]|uniref:sensor histidine kinase n=1 Tax=Acidovorax sp. TaxID=1872122 RepID=UPI002ACE21DE|nr:histidine kinase [Acidovorax sp.]MDZ7862236.1 histidine kinase [Acidovorax sp.]